MKFLSQFEFSSWRTKNIAKHIVLSFFYKGMSIVFGFALVPLCIRYLQPETYGIWLTISSFLSWFSFFDIGLGNGLRNKIAEARALNQLNEIKKYVSAAYTSIGLISLLLIILFLLANFFIDWIAIFNARPEFKEDLQVLMPLVFVFFALQLVLKIIISLYVADQYHSVQGKFNFFSQGFSLAAVWLLNKYFPSSLIGFGLIFSFIPVLLLLCLTIVAFSSRYKFCSPIFMFKDLSYMKGVFGLGMKFFLIQIAGIVLFSTGNMLVTQLFTPDHVVSYNLAFQFFGVSNMLFSIILAPYWTSVTDAFFKQEFDWIKLSMKRMIRISYFFILLLVLMIFIAPFIYDIWVGSGIGIEPSINIWMALLFIIIVFYSPYTYFINGIGKIKLQMYSLILSSLVNIPLCVFLAKNMQMGVGGVVAGSVISLLPHAILSPIQYYKIINQKANGIWLA